VNDIYATVVVLTVATHFAFIAYMVTGGFFALRWRRTIWLHVPVVMWGVAIEVIAFVCPLTALERWARARAGMAPLPSEGFIAHYLTGVVYPARAANLVLAVAVMAVLTSWARYAVSGRRRSSAMRAGLS
jgi:hypothetical protein